MFVLHVIVLFFLAMPVFVVMFISACFQRTNLGRAIDKKVPTMYVVYCVLIPAIFLFLVFSNRNDPSHLFAGYTALAMVGNGFITGFFRRVGT